VQHLLFSQPELQMARLAAGGLAVNVVAFRMLGLLPGLAILSGKWRRANAQERQKLKRKSTRQLSTNTVAVDFEPPRLALMGGKLLPPLQVRLRLVYEAQPHEALPQDPPRTSRP